MQTKNPLLITGSYIGALFGFLFSIVVQRVFNQGYSLTLLVTFVVIGFLLGWKVQVHLGDEKDV